MYWFLWSTNNILFEIEQNYCLIIWEPLRLKLYQYWNQILIISRITTWADNIPKSSGHGAVHLEKTIRGNIFQCSKRHCIGFICILFKGGTLMRYPRNSSSTDVHLYGYQVIPDGKSYVKITLIIVMSIKLKFTSA